MVVIILNLKQHNHRSTRGVAKQIKRHIPYQSRHASTSSTLFPCSRFSSVGTTGNSPEWSWWNRNFI